MSQCARVRMSGWTKMRNTSRSIWPGDKQSRQKNKTDFFFRNLQIIRCLFFYPKEICEQYVTIPQLFLGDGNSVFNQANTISTFRVSRKN